LGKTCLQASIYEALRNPLSFRKRRYVNLTSLSASCGSSRGLALRCILAAAAFIPTAVGVACLWHSGGLSARFSVKQKSNKSKMAIIARNVKTGKELEVKMDFATAIVCEDKKGIKYSVNVDNPDVTIVSAQIP
jgi:hypothetical protein